MSQPLKKAVLFFFVFLAFFLAFFTSYSLKQGTSLYTAGEVFFWVLKKGQFSLAYQESSRELKKKYTLSAFEESVKKDGLHRFDEIFPEKGSSPKLVTPDPKKPKMQMGEIIYILRQGNQPSRKVLLRLLRERRKWRVLDWKILEVAKKEGKQK
ncbi:MAG: hypothetical protein D6785_05820 [Planctomycetota bacterium]|nr:MAG: hypothetical protein D6785_05820 [Planctomycetota bacterium]